MAINNSWTQVDPLMQAQGELVLRKLVDAGYPSYFVGGCVRDELMSRPVHDMDIASSATPEQVIALFEHVIPTGLQHGTVTVLMENKFHFEVTTFRTESTYGDHRRPSAVQFVTDITEDLKRRDFTMNAIARDVNGQLTDPFGGAKDIESKTLRCVGLASERFDEDALRMLRAVRFASVFSFRPVKSLWAGLLAEKAKLKHIAIERVRAELTRVVLGPDPLYGLALIKRSGLYHYFKVPMSWSGSINDDLLNTLPIAPADCPIIRWSLLLQGLSYSSSQSLDLMKSWTFSNEEAEGTSKLILFDELWHEQLAEDQELEPLRRSWIKLELELGKQSSEDWLKREGLLQSTGRYEQFLAWHKEISIHAPHQLCITGKDVLETTQKQGGPWLGQFLKKVTYLVAVGDLSNEKEILLEAANKEVIQNGI